MNFFRKTGDIGAEAPSPLSLFVIRIRTCGGEIQLRFRSGQGKRGSRGNRRRVLDDAGMRPCFIDRKSLCFAFA
jgi:hypothetical protein